ncbi:hypothetical protein D3C86_1969870 [compost metagenome]
MQFGEGRDGVHARRDLVTHYFRHHRRATAIRYQRTAGARLADELHGKEMQQRANRADADRIVSRLGPGGLDEVGQCLDG